MLKIHMKLGTVTSQACVFSMNKNMGKWVSAMSSKEQTGSRRDRVYGWAITVNGRKVECWLVGWLGLDRERLLYSIWKWDNMGK